jgi:zinc D-Ala-D-Ala dipeptidase
MLNTKKLLLPLFALLFTANAYALPEDFVYLHDIDPTIIQDIRYATSDNFMARPLKDYQAKLCILTREAALALAAIQRKLKQQSFGLKVYDCYRPQAAVNDIIAWSKDSKDKKNQHAYYPEVNKEDLFKLGYVAEHSGHSRGSTVDLTLVKFISDKSDMHVDLAMGSHFDYMDEISNTYNKQIQGESRENRIFLRKVMLENGFEPYDKEWWHFTLIKEPFPNTYFDFPVK